MAAAFPIQREQQNECNSAVAAVAAERARESARTLNQTVGRLRLQVSLFVCSHKDWACIGTVRCVRQIVRADWRIYDACNLDA